jgi:hypothetical protein
LQCEGFAYARAKPLAELGGRVVRMTGIAFE